MRKIIHIDMDAFFASVEQLDDPSLKGKPVAVGGSRQRGVVAAASYEARQFGVRSAMPSSQAARLCPNLIFVKPRFERYKEISDQIRDIFFEYTDLVEPLSLDEAFLDVTHNLKGIHSASRIAKEIRARIYEETGLTASAGVSINKFIAKVASDYHKPNGLTLIKPENVDGFVAELPVGKFFGIGKVTAARLISMGIHTGAELRTLSRPELVRLFGKAGKYYYDIARGIDERPVKPDRVRKSVGAENTYSSDLHELDEQKLALDELSGVLAGRLKRTGLKGRTIVLKLRYNDFRTFTRSQTIEEFTGDESVIRKIAHELLESHPRELPVRLLGITVTNLDNKIEETRNGQYTLEF